ncbi:MAG TPA: glutathione S-transferase family protein [Hyphomonadaceae bacterium]|nr:glutathione S-transferase family protein [Hyphomonadaceae bacterium]
MGYVLIGTEPSQFSGKARGYLRWKGVDFAEQTATPEVYRDIIEPRVGFAVIPILLTPDNQVVQDTADIIDFIEQRHPTPNVYPAGPVQKLVSLLVELYADEWLVIPAMHYRWSENESWITEEFGRIAAPAASREEQIRIGQVIAAPVKDSIPRLGVSEETVSGIEAHYEGFLADYSAHLRRMPFLLGGRPSLGDFALFGPLYGPLYRDPASGERMRRLAPVVAEWVERMRDVPTIEGEPTPGDEIPLTIHPILKRQMTEQLPDLIDSARVLQEWSLAQPKGARVKRSLGTHEFAIGGRRGDRSIVSFSLWRLQRVLDHYRSLAGPDRERADKLLAAVGGRALSSFQLPVRLERRDYRLVIA